MIHLFWNSIPIWDYFSLSTSVKYHILEWYTVLTVQNELILKCHQSLWHKWELDGGLSSGKKIFVFVISHFQLFCILFWVTSWPLAIHAWRDSSCFCPIRQAEQNMILSQERVKEAHYLREYSPFSALKQTILLFV